VLARTNRTKICDVFRFIAIVSLALSALGAAFVLLLLWGFGYDYENSQIGRSGWLLLLVVFGVGAGAPWIAIYGVATRSRAPALIGAIGQAAAAASFVIIVAVRDGGSDDSLSAILALVLFLDATVTFWAWPRSETTHDSSASVG
jgi:hypothetical protein